MTMSSRQSILDFLRNLADQRKNLARFELSRSEFFQLFRDEFPGAPPEEPALTFEQIEDELAQGIFLGEWKVAYHPISSQLILDRVLRLGTIERQVDIKNSYIREALKQKLEELTGEQFERAMVELFRGLPWIQDVQQTQLRKDGGIDFHASISSEGVGDLAAIGQVKRTKSKTSAPGLREFVGSSLMSEMTAQVGIFLSFSGFTDDAREAARKAPIKLRLHDLDDITQWMAEYKTGLRQGQFTVTDLDSTFWREIENE